MLDESDKALFRATVNNNVPLDKDKMRQPIHAKQAPFATYRYISDAKFSGADVLAYAKSGVSNKIIKKMKQGNIGNMPVLDLHGQNVIEACQSISQFIYRHQCKQFIQIIHGKGYHCENQMSILKTQVVSFLKQHPGVLAFNSCPPKNGGTGAVFALLKSTTAQ